MSAAAFKRTRGGSISSSEDSDQPAKKTPKKNNNEPACMTPLDIADVIPLDVSRSAQRTKNGNSGASQDEVCVPKSASEPVCNSRITKKPSGTSYLKSTGTTVLKLKSAMLASVDAGESDYYASVSTPEPVCQSDVNKNNSNSPLFEPDTTTPTTSNHALRDSGSAAVGGSLINHMSSFMTGGEDDSDLESAASKADATLIGEVQGAKAGSRENVDNADDEVVDISQHGKPREDLVTQRMRYGAGDPTTKRVSWGGDVQGGEEAITAVDSNDTAVTNNGQDDAAIDSVMDFTFDDDINTPTAGRSARTTIDHSLVKQWASSTYKNYDLASPPSSPASSLVTSLSDVPLPAMDPDDDLLTHLSKQDQLIYKLKGLFEHERRVAKKQSELIVYLKAAKKLSIVVEADKKKVKVMKSISAMKGEVAKIDEKIKISSKSWG